MKDTPKNMDKLKRYIRNLTTLKVQDEGIGMNKADLERIFEPFFTKKIMGRSGTGLDMIMDPGIDGLETYKRIIQIRPDQRAIIASGFSETSRVKEMMALGASQYIKKPYGLNDIGKSVKEALSI